MSDEIRITNIIIGRSGYPDNTDQVILTLHFSNGEVNSYVWPLDIFEKLCEPIEEGSFQLYQAEDPERNHAIETMITSEMHKEQMKNADEEVLHENFKPTSYEE